MSFFITGKSLHRIGSGVKEKIEKSFNGEKRPVFTGGNEDWTWNVLGCERGDKGWEGDGKGMGRGKGLRDATLPRKVLGMKGKPWEKAKALYLAGKSWKAIASETGLNQSTLMSKASREDWTTFRKGMRDTISSKETVSLESLSALVRSKLAQDAASTLERIEGYALDGIKDESVRETILASVAKRSALTFGWSETGEAPSVSVNILGALPDRTEVHVEPQTK